VAIESTFVMIKPDGVRRGLTGEVIARFERKGLRLARARLLTIDRALAERHYAEHVGKAFFEDLVAFITSGPVLAMEWSGDGAVEVARTLMGITDPKKAAPGTIRGDFGLVVTENVVHGSDSPASAERELGLFFP
jgi:nucleoside-diphosphate kinase